jgi:transposase
MATTTSLEDRIEIGKASAAGEAVWRLARRLRWQKSTIRKWRQRGRSLGRAGLESRMGRPARGAMSSFSAEQRERISQMRQVHPGWGALTLRTELEQDATLVQEDLPSAAAIGRFLKERGLTQAPEKHSPLPQTEQHSAGAAHDVWEMDAQGYSKVPDVGVVTLINLNDRYSHVRLLSYPCCLGRQRASRHATTEDYQAALRLAFMEWGLPRTLQVDHESVFYDNKSKSPFPTRLHLWLLALGVTLTFGRVHQPKDQAMTERSHQLWTDQVLRGNTFVDWHALYDSLVQRRDFLNRALPCRTLGDRPPLMAFPEALHSSRPYRLEYEAELLALPAVYAYLAQGHWFRLVGDNGTISLGGHVYSVGLPWRRHQLEITFDAETLLLAFADSAGHVVFHAPICGISVSDLMGDWHHFTSLPAFQLALPFTWEDQRLTRLYERAT